jgi:DNA-binding GntR family transcriptional regulator
MQSMSEHALAGLNLGASGVRTAHRDVIDRLRRAILTGVLPPGARLVQAELAKSLRVSVTPIREALRDLINEGLVDFDAYRGATVHVPSLSELEDIYEIRILLTPAVVRDAIARITAADLDRAREVHAQMESTTEPAAWVALNREFHHVLTAPAGRAHLLDVIGRMSDLSDLYVGVSIGDAAGPRHRGDSDHAELLAAYEAGDVERAIAVSIKHIDETLNDARTAISGQAAGQEPAPSETGSPVAGSAAAW